MGDGSGSGTFYGTLAPWWPLISPVEDYAEEAAYIADMRSLRLDETFDAVLVHDAIDYMTTEHDLAAAFETAAAHLQPSGQLLIVPDDTAESFEADSEVGGNDGPDSRSRSGSGNGNQMAHRRR